VAVVVRALVPAMPWAPAIALGAVVAPPDAVGRDGGAPPAAAAASHSHDSRRREPAERRERLLIYRLAVGAVAANGFSRRAWPDVLLAVAGSCRRSGARVARAAVAESRAARADGIILQFVTTFGVWMLADRSACRRC
jgi:CPA1 family monovalent cation:H+ antiporter